MQTTITARHCEISDALRERAAAVVDRLGTFATRPFKASNGSGALEVSAAW